MTKRASAADQVTVQTVRSSGRTKSGRTKAEQREISLEKLLAAAQEMFVSNGYHATTLENIAAHAGLTKGAVYFYFRSKEAVLIRLLESAEGVAVDDIIRQLDQSDAPAVEKLVQFFHHQSQMSLSSDSDILLLILMSLEFKNEDGQVGETVRRVWTRLHDCIEEILRQGIAAGEIDNQVPLKELTAIMLALHDGTFLEWYRWGKDLDGRRLTQVVRALVLGGVPRG